ncbi:MAG: alpha/beta hydrolase [Ginsengibacter sp.]
MKMKAFYLIAFLCLFPFFNKLRAQIPYPYPVKNFTVNIDGQGYQMSYMDVQPLKPNGKNVLLFHGKNFTGFYWKDVIKFLVSQGYRVIVADQLGWGKSSKPSIKYTFEMLAQNNKLLLDSLKIEKVTVIGHSMGGMLATRFAILYPTVTAKLILEDPLGLEDYRKFVPFKSIDEQYKKELNATYASYKKYQESYYPVWKPGYEVYVKQQAELLKTKDFTGVALVNALTYQMIYEQPVLYDFKKLEMPVLFIVGQLDRTILGKEKLDKAKQHLHGNFPSLAKKASMQIKDSKVIVLPGVGHIPHIQETKTFNNKVLAFM